MKNMYESFKKSRWFPLITGIIFAVFGVLCLANPQSKMQSLALYGGVALLVYGLFQVLAGVLTKEDKKLRFLHIALGAVVILLAILNFVNLEMVGKYLPVLLGFFMILSALSELFRSLVLLKHGVKSWWFGAILAVVLLIFGFVFLLKPGYVGQAFGIFTGISLLVFALSNLCDFMQFKK